MGKVRYTENLLQVLKKLSPREIKEFELFLMSPYFNTRGLLAKLFLIIKKYYPAFDMAVYSKEKVFEELYGKKKINAGIMNEAYSALYRMALKYLQQQQAEKKFASLEISMLDTLRGKKLDSQFNKLNNKINLYLLQESDNRNNLIDQYDAVLANYNYFVSQLSKSKRKNSIEELGLAFTAFRKITLFYITNVTVLFINSKITSVAFNKKIAGEFNLLFDNGIFEKLLVEVHWDKKEKIIVNLYRGFFHLVKTPKNKKKFENYKNFIDNNLHNLDKTELLFHLHFLISLYRKFYKDSREIEFKLRTLALREMILFEGIYISEFNKEFLSLDFRNIVMDIVNLSLPNRLVKLIPYVSKLPHMYQLTFENYINAYYFFLKNDFNKSLEYSSKVNNSEKRLLIDMEIMRIKIFFLNDEFAACVDRINTMKKYLSECEDMNKESILLYMEFLKVIQKSILFLEREDGISLNILLDRVSKKVNMIFKEWYLNYIQNLLSSFSNKKLKIGMY
jgi:hypothetical protein